MKILLNYIFDDFGITICPKLSSFLTVILLMPCAVRLQLPSELRLVSVSLIFFPSSMVMHWSMRNWGYSAGWRRWTGAAMISWSRGYLCWASRFLPGDMFFFFTFSQSNARLHGISSSFSTSRITLSHTHINERTTQSSVDFVGWTRTRTAYSLKGVKLIVAQPKRKGSLGISSFFLPDVLIYWIVRKAWMNQKSR